VGGDAPPHSPRAGESNHTDPSAHKLNGSSGAEPETDSTNPTNPSAFGRNGISGAEPETDLLNRLKTELKCERKLPEVAWRRWRLRRLDSQLEATAQVLPLLEAAAALGSWPREWWPAPRADETGRASDGTGRASDGTGRASDGTGWAKAVRGEDGGGGAGGVFFLPSARPLRLLAGGVGRERLAALPAAAGVCSLLNRRR
jgi:hypothetical protein